MIFVKTYTAHCNNKLAFKTNVPEQMTSYTEVPVLEFYSQWWELSLGMNERWLHQFFGRILLWLLCKGHIEPGSHGTNTYVETHHHHFSPHLCQTASSEK